MNPADIIYNGLPQLLAEDRLFGYTMYDLLVHALLPTDPTLKDQYEMGGMDWIRATYEFYQLQIMFNFTDGTSSWTYKDWINVTHRMHLAMVPHAK